MLFFLNIYTIDFDINFSNPSTVFCSEENNIRFFDIQTKFVSYQPFRDMDQFIVKRLL